MDGLKIIKIRESLFEPILCYTIRVSSGNYTYWINIAFISFITTIVVWIIFHHSWPPSQRMKRLSISLYVSQPLCIHSWNTNSKSIYHGYPGTLAQTNEPATNGV